MAVVAKAKKGDKLMDKRSLYQCFEAKVKNDRICCEAGHSLNKIGKDGTINILALSRGDPLELGVCQGCNDYDEMGPPVAPEDRGWVHPPGFQTTKRRGRPRKMRVSP